MSKPVVATQGYPDLPTKFGEASLGRSDWFGTDARPNKPQDMLRKYGFLILRGYLPDNIVAPARLCVEAQFKTVMGSLTNGFATDDFDKLNGIPSHVWDYKAASRGEISKFTKLSFPYETGASTLDNIGRIGLDVDVDGSVVESQAWSSST